MIYEIKKSLKDMPFVLIFVRSLYGLTRAIARRVSRERASFQSYLVPFDDDFKHNFCGYYDHSPFMESNESLLLVHSTNASIYRGANPTEPVSARLIEWRTGKQIERLGETYAWNWQQGSRLMWIGDKRWIFNTFDTERNDYGSILGEVGSSKRTFLPYSVQEISPLNHFYSINYAALSVIRPDYGYFNRSARFSDFESSGILEVSFTGCARCIVRIDDIKEEVETRRGEVIRNYKFNHVLCSPNGLHLVFLFRYFLKNGRRITDVYLYRCEDDVVELLVSDAGVSHYCWINCNQLIYTGVHSGQFGYYSVDTSGARSGPLFGVSVDGHPVHVHGDSLITDTYPSRLGIRSLLLLESRQDGCQTGPSEIASFVEPWYLWGTRRCDLHPSVSLTRKFWQVDVVNQGRRGVCVGNV